MNEIEKKYFEAFRNFVNDELSIPIISNDNLRLNLTISDVDYQQDSILLNVKLNNLHLDSEKQFEIEIRNSAMDFNGYKPDFLIEVELIAPTRFAIEIDGHEWHEKTKEQAANDKRKDRAYLKNNVIPIRFTGSEVYHDAINCVKETLEILVFQTAYRIFS